MPVSVTYTVPDAPIAICDGRENWPGALPDEPNALTKWRSSSGYWSRTIRSFPVSATKTVPRSSAAIPSGLANWPGPLPLSP